MFVFTIISDDDMTEEEAQRVRHQFLMLDWVNQVAVTQDSEEEETHGNQVR